MSNVFASLPDLIDIVSEGSESTLTTPTSPRFPGQSDPMVVTSPTVPLEAYSHLDLLDIWRGATYRLRANGIAGTPSILEFITSSDPLPAFASAPTPQHAPAVSTAQAVAPPNVPTVVYDRASSPLPCFVCHVNGDELCFVCRAKAHLAVAEAEFAGPSNNVDNAVSFAQDDREPRPYFIHGDAFLRYDAYNAIDVPARQKSDTPLAIEWRPLKSVVNRVATPIPTSPTERPVERVFRRTDARRLRREDQEVTPTSSMFETMSAFQAVGHAYISTINKLYDMSDDERELVMYVLNALMPANYKPQVVEAVASVVRAAIHAYGIDYLFKLRGGREVWLRDIDLWRSPNARVTVLHYWTTRRASITVADIDRLIKLPQYSAQDGQFLINMRYKMRRGIKNPVPVFADLP